MDDFLNELRMQGVKAKAASVVSTLILTFLLTACGGGSAPEDEAEQRVSVNASNDFASSTTNSIKETVLFISEPQARPFCQQNNLILCENFEWSSSLNYKATNEDWLLKGWQFQANELSGNVCNSIASDGSQCGLKFDVESNRTIQTEDGVLQQKASYPFSNAQLLDEQIDIRWQAKWSKGWRWSTSPIPYFKLLAKDYNQAFLPIISIHVTEDGIPKLVLDDRLRCNDENQISTDINQVAIVGDILGQWHEFELRYNASMVNQTLSVRLMMNNSLIAAATWDIACENLATTASSGMNQIQFLADRYSDTNNEFQSMFIDNISMSYRL